MECKYVTVSLFFLSLHLAYLSIQLNTQKFQLRKIIRISNTPTEKTKNKNSTNNNKSKIFIKERTTVEGVD